MVLETDRTALPPGPWFPDSGTSGHLDRDPFSSHFYLGCKLASDLAL